jgi:hypothetical protein
MVVVPAGRFTMGSSDNEKGRQDNEGPQHTVTIGKPFAVGKFDVTFAEWDACVDAGVCRSASDSGWGRGDRPVINVSWDDVNLYIAWVSYSGTGFWQTSARTRGPRIRIDALVCSTLYQDAYNFAFQGTSIRMGALCTPAHLSASPDFEANEPALRWLEIA